MKITRLSVSNVKRLVAVDIEPDGSLVVIGGRNAQGKSSVLDSIMFAMAGGKSLPAAPIRTGERRASTVVELDNGLTVTRTYDAKGSKLTVTNELDAKMKSPQALLDDLCGRISFDPLEYNRLSGKKQAATLRDLLGIDTSELDGQRSALFDRRTEVNRTTKALGARAEADGMQATPEHKAAPAEEVSVADLTEELERRQGVIATNQRARESVASLESQAGGHESTVIRIDSDIAAAENKIAQLREERVEFEAKAAEANKVATAAEEEAAKLVDPDLEEVREQLRTAQDTNRLVRENQERVKLAKELSGSHDDGVMLTDQIEDIDAQKRALLEQAEFPIPGLGFDEDGVTLDGVPMEQASQADRLRLSVAIGIAMNPKLRVLLIRDGSLLDSDSLAMVAKMAEDSDSQVWLEVVTRHEGDEESCSVVIEDGAVKGAS